jgi:hypothetical protein
VLCWRNASSVTSHPTSYTISDHFLPWLSQAIALVFEHITSDDHEISASVDPAELSDVAHIESPRSDTLAPLAGATSAGLKLLDDLCNMASGKNCSRVVLFSSHRK